MKPQFETLSDFINMNGYAAYVWSSWGLCLLVIFALGIGAIANYKKTKSRLEKLEQENAN